MDMDITYILHCYRERNLHYVEPLFCGPRPLHQPLGSLQVLMFLHKCLGPLLPDMRLLFPSQSSWEPGVKWGPSLSWSTQDAANGSCLDTGFLFPSLSTVQSPTAEQHPPLPPLSFQLSPSCRAYSPHLLSWRACGCDVMWWEVKSSGRL